MEASPSPPSGDVSHPEPPETVADLEGDVRTPHVLWLTPDKPDDISVGRSRIAERLESAGIEVTVRGTTPGTVLDALRNGDSHDTIVGTTRSGAIAATLVSTVTDTPLIVDHVDPIRQLAETNSTWLATLVRWFEDVAFWRADRVLFVYEEEAPRVRRFADVSRSTDLGVDFDRIADPSRKVRDLAHSRLAAENLEENVAIYVGGLEPIYHVETMLDAADYLDGWSLVVLGTGSLEPDVQRAAMDSDGVVFLGSVPHEEVPGYLHAADVGVCLVDDPRTLKVLEYGAASLPTVHLDGRSRSRFGDLVEYCEDDPESVARAIQRAQDRDGEALQEFARRFDWDAIGSQYRQAVLAAMG